ncbi:uncharacterized protein [Argopecten irradians]|uniref:uncharacterized protein isoform X2 n=1 Tax=Argopecten irradians TaxID=31199 RepID=UPI00371F7902
MTTMANCSLLVAILLLVLKVESRPTTTTDLPTTPLSNSSIYTFHDPSKHQGSSPGQGQHGHHGDNTNLLEKDENNHISPVVQSFTDCVYGCLHPKHGHPQPPNARFYGHHGGGSESYGHIPDGHNQLDDIMDGDDSENILLQVEHLVRTSNLHNSPIDHPSPEDGHHSYPNDQQAEDSSTSQYWMCSHACLINMGPLTVG